MFASLVWLHHANSCNPLVIWVSEAWKTKRFWLLCEIVEHESLQSFFLLVYVLARESPASAWLVRAC